MPIDQEALSTFVNEYGPVSIVDSRGTTKRLNGGSQETFHTYQNAEKVFFGSEWRSREEFEHIVEERMAEYYS